MLALHGQLEERVQHGKRLQRAHELGIVAEWPLVRFVEHRRQRRGKEGAYLGGRGHRLLAIRGVSAQYRSLHTVLGRFGLHQDCSRKRKSGASSPFSSDYTRIGSVYR